MGFNEKELHILLIEDSENDVVLFQNFIKQIHTPSILMTVVPSLSKAERFLKQIKFDLIFTDLSLPDSEGTETIKTLEQKTINTPLIVLTGREDDQTLGEIVGHANVYDYITKSELNINVLRRSILYSITKKVANDDRRCFEAQLRQAQKMEIVGQLTSGIAHDFNNKLTIMLGCIAAADSQLDEGHPAKRFLNRANQSVETAVGLTKKLLSFGRKAQVENDHVDSVEDVIRQTMHVVSDLIDKNIQVSLQVEEELFPVCAGVTDIDQIIMNLVINARDAISGQGNINVYVERALGVASHARAYCGEPKEGDYLLVSVQDTGSGMSAETIAKIFQPFFTTKNEGSGTGLGMSVVKGIITDCNGLMDVESKEGHGTTFKVYIPKYKEKDDSSTEELKTAA